MHWGANGERLLEAAADEDARGRMRSSSYVCACACACVFSVVGCSVNCLNVLFLISGLNGDRGRSFIVAGKNGTAGDVLRKGTGCAMNLVKSSSSRGPFSSKTNRSHRQYSFKHDPCSTDPAHSTEDINQLHCSASSTQQRPKIDLQQSQPLLTHKHTSRCSEPDSLISLEERGTDDDEAAIDRVAQRKKRSAPRRGNAARCCSARTRLRASTSGARVGRCRRRYRRFAPQT